MADYPEKPASSDTATESGATDGISARDKVMFGQSLLTAALDEATGLLKLQLGLQTGAVVLFVKVLTDVCAPKLVLAALAVSALLFGASAALVPGSARWPGRVTGQDAYPIGLTIKADPRCSKLSSKRGKRRCGRVAD